MLPFGLAAADVQLFYKSRLSKFDTKQRVYATFLRDLRRLCCKSYRRPERKAIILLEQSSVNLCPVNHFLIMKTLIIYNSARYHFLQLDK